MLRKLGPLLLAAAALALGACGGGDGGGSDDKAADDEPVRDRRITMPYTLTLTGDLDVRFDQELEVRVMTVSAKSPEVSISLLSAGAAEPFALPTGALLRAAFDLSGYEGDGDYTVQAGSPRERVASGQAPVGQGAGTADQSNVLVQHWPTGDVKQAPEVFDHVLVPCPLEVSDDGLRGVLRCEGVRNQRGDRSVSLEMRWGQAKQ